MTHKNETEVKTLILNNIGNNNIGRETSPEMSSENNYAKSNKVLLNNISNWYLFEKQSIFSIPLLKKYENVLKRDLLNYEISENFFYRPEYVSNDLYGTTDLWYLLLFVNDMQTVDQFNKKVIKVFPENTINNLNKIINAEADKIGTENNPIAIYKHFMKSLDEKSNTLRGVFKDNTVIPFTPELEFNDKLDKIINDRYLRDRYSVYEDKFYIPDSENKDLVVPFTLNNEGLKTLPNIFYKNGFKRKFKGKIYFKPGERYLYTPLHNGTSNIKITDSKGFTVLNAKEKFQFKAPTLLFDLRSANDNDVEHSNLESTKLSSVSFNKDTGKYEVKASMINKPDKTDGSDASFVKITIDGDNINPRMNLKRILDYDFISFNMGYNIKFQDNNKPTAKLIFELSALTNTGKTIKMDEIFKGKNSNYNTMGNKSYLKHIMYNNKNIKELYVTVKLVDFENMNPNETIEISLDELEIAGINHDEFNNDFVVTKEDWYDIEMDYEYNINNPDNSYFYEDESRSGIYFNPMIVAVRSYGTYPVDNQKYTGFFNHTLTKQSMGKYSYISFVDGTRKFDDDSLNYVYSQNFKFPRDYIMTLKLNNKNNTGGAGIVFDYNNNLNSGYMLWISSKQENWDVPYFDLDDQDVMNDPERIMESGFYEIDKVYGEPKPIFNNESEKQLYVTNHVPFSMKNKYVKIIKNNNRIRVFVSSTDKFDHRNPQVDIKDIENINMDGRMGFISAFSGLEVEFINYFEYENAYDN